jgi:hypothetical protein
VCRLHDGFHRAPSLYVTAMGEELFRFKSNDRRINRLDSFIAFQYNVFLFLEHCEDIQENIEPIVVVLCLMIDTNCGGACY